MTARQYVIRMHGRREATRLRFFERRSGFDRRARVAGAQLDLFDLAGR